MPTLHEPKSFIVPAQGALLSLPGSQGTERRIWMTQGAMRRAQHPMPGLLSVYAPDFFLDAPKPWHIPEDVTNTNWAQEFSNRDLLDRLTPFAALSPPPAPLSWAPLPRTLFEESFRDLQDCFGSGQLTKAVPVCFENASCSDATSQIAQRITKLLQAPETLMPYGVWSEQGGVLGASPELLFQIQEGVLRTVALAGTLAVPDAENWDGQEDAERAFLADSKERREHDLVIEGIAESLAPFGSVKVGETRVLKLPTLWHLRTPIEVTLRNTPDFETVVRRLHPTPALGGSPRDASLAWLRRQDTFQQPLSRRGSFGAPFGVQFPDGSAFCLVAVRSLMWDADTVRIGSGCGVIRESRLEREWEELAQKRKSVKRLFGL